MIKERCKRIYDTQDLWLEHYAFGRPHGDPKRYSEQPGNRERSLVQERAMDAVREACTSRDGGYIGEKLGRIEDNYLGLYDRNPVDWAEFQKMWPGDKKIFKKFNDLEKEKLRPLYDTVKNPFLRRAVTSCMDFTVLVSKPTVTRSELNRSFKRCKLDMTKMLGKHYERS